MRPRVILLALLMASVLTFVAQVHGIAPYSLSINPPTTSLGNSVTITVTVTNGARNTLYGVTIGVQKPNGTGSAISNQVVSTDNRGSGSVSVQYGQSSTSWTSLNGTVNTNVGGVYNVAVNQTSPSNIANVVTGQFTVTATKSELFVDAMVTYNSKGIPSTSFSSGDTLYPYFRIKYSGSSGGFLASGQYVVSVKNPSGITVANLTAVYDANRLGFYTPTGYSVSTFDPGGAWTVGVDANSLNDGFGNTGPSIATSIRVDIVTSPLGYLPFVIGGVVALLGGIVVLKRYETSLAGFEHLEQMIGGPIPRGSSLLLLGDPGSGKTVLSYELLHDELEAGRPCALLSYDAFPEDVQSRMGEFGWDIISHLRKGRLKIIDCYSGLAGEGGGGLQDTSDRS